MNETLLPFPLLETDRLVMRQVTFDDDNEIMFQRSDESMNKYDAIPSEASIIDIRIWIWQVVNQIGMDGMTFWGIALKDEPKLIGNFTLSINEDDEEKGEIGYALVPEHRGFGYMQEVVKKGVAYGFEELGMKVIEAYVHPENKASQNVLLNCGFKMLERRGTKRKSGFYTFEIRKEDIQFQNENNKL